MTEQARGRAEVAALLLQKSCERKRYEANIRRYKRLIEMHSVLIHILDQEIESYASKWMVPVQSLPTEILLQIFQWYLNHNHSHIRRLMLVCRRWNEIIIDSQTLWGKLVISIEKYESPSTTRQRMPYIKACLQRSGDKPLDITMDFEGAAYIDNFGIGALEKLIGDQFLDANYSDYLANEQMKRRLNFWAGRINWKSCPLNYGMKAQYMLLLRLVIGAQGEHMLRWKYFSCRVPSSEDSNLPAKDVWLLFSHPTPILESLSLCGFRDSQEYEPALRGVTIFPRLPKLRRLDILGMSLEFSRLLVVPRLIETMDIDQFKDVRSYWKLFTLTELVTLKICYNDNVRIPYVSFFPCRSTLPRLKLFEVVGEAKVFPLFELFHLPALETLILRGTGSVSAVSSTAFAKTVPNVHLFYSGPIQEIVKRFLPVFSSAITISVLEGHKETFLQSLVELAGDNPPLLENLIVYDVSGTIIQNKINLKKLLQLLG